MIRDWHARLSVGPSGMRSSGFSWLGAVVLVSVGVLWGIFIVGFLISLIGSLFIVGIRLFVGGGIGHVRILVVRSKKWLRSDLVPRALFLQCEPHLTHGGSRSLLIQPGLMRNSEKPGFPNFCRCGQIALTLFFVPLGTLLHWILRRFFSGVVDSDIHLFVADVI